MADLPALAEIVDDGKTGRLYPAGNYQTLAEIIHELLLNSELREYLGRNAASWVIANRTWQSVVEETSISKFEGYK
jgi:glycosyltransferase involved in cell wall biosynthesis